MARNSQKKDSKGGVGVDEDAVALREPVTVVVSPAGNKYDCDDWVDAYNKLSDGYSIADGFPTGPLPTDATGADESSTRAEPGHAAAAAGPAPAGS